MTSIALGQIPLFLHPIPIPFSRSVALHSTRPSLPPSIGRDGQSIHRSADQGTRLVSSLREKVFWRVLLRISLPLRIDLRKMGEREYVDRGIAFFQSGRNRRPAIFYLDPVGLILRRNSIPFSLSPSLSAFPTLYPYHPSLFLPLSPLPSLPPRSLPPSPPPTPL